MYAGCGFPPRNTPTPSAVAVEFTLGGARSSVVTTSLCRARAGGLDASSVSADDHGRWRDNLPTGTVTFLLPTSKGRRRSCTSWAWRHSQTPSPCTPTKAFGSHPNLILVRGIDPPFEGQTGDLRSRSHRECRKPPSRAPADVPYSERPPPPSSQVLSSCRLWRAPRWNTMGRSLRPTSES